MTIREESFRGLGLDIEQVSSYQDLYISKSRLSAKPGDLIEFVFDQPLRGNKSLMCSFAFKVNSYDDVTHRLSLDLATPLGFKKAD